MIMKYQRRSKLFKVRCDPIQYASVVQKTCGSTLAPKVIQTAVKKATVTDVRDQNLIFHGMKEEEGEI